MKTVKNGHKRHIRLDAILLIIGVVCLSIFAGISYYNAMEEKRSRKTVQQLRSMRDVGIAPRVDSSQTDTEKQDAITTSYERLFEANADMIGWLNIPGTQIDYPVMQTLEDEEYYLRRNFYKEKDKNGCLLMDTDSDIHMAGANLIIHGHNMKSGDMFGTLQDYQEQEYGMEHNKLYLYTRDEKREYELIAVFFSKVYLQTDQVFKYYQYFGGEDQDAFDSFYSNIKKLSLYDTGAEAEYGDEFLTLSTCAYQTKNGRFVVVAKRIEE